ncbi:hypothetical protein PI124_g12544 [Phytophthora idaei]|nr:hypothetical protein PI124_g12544 [Phytophthora idaei]
MLLRGEWAHTTGIVLQTKAQREVFSRWGDTFGLDWTHNCTKLGFYVGSLIASVGTGRGVSVFDFLGLNQQKNRF